MLRWYVVSAGGTSELLLLVKWLVRADMIPYKLRFSLNTTLNFISAVQLRASVIHTDDLQVHMKAVC